MTSPPPPVCIRLAQLTRSLAEGRLPPRIVDEARLCLVDFLASVLAAEPEPLTSQMAPLFGSGGARLLADDQAVSEAGAVWLHGFLATVEDVDDAHAFASGMHLSATVLPVTLALAQSRGASNARVLRAIVAGYEIGGRLVRGMDSGLRLKGFHSTGVIGPFAACAAAGVLLGLDEATLAHAFGIVTSQAGGLFAFLPTGASVRHTHAAHAGLAGLAAASAAQAGVTGPVHAFEGPDGFVEPYAGTFDEYFLSAAPPTESATYEITNAYHKRFSACGHAVPAITLALELRPLLSSQLERITSIEVEGYRASAALTKWPADTVGAAKFSIPAIVSLALIHGDVSASQMCLEALSDPAVQSLAARVSLREDPALSSVFPQRRAGRIAISLADGETLRGETDRPIGMPGNALTPRDVDAKFRLLAEPRIGAARAHALMSAANSLVDGARRFRPS